MNPSVQLIDVNHVLPPITEQQIPTGNLVGRDVNQNCGPVEARIQELAVAVNTSGSNPGDVEAGQRRVSYLQSYEFRERCRTFGMVSTAVIGLLCMIAGLAFVVLGFYNYAHGKGGQADMFMGLAIGVGFCAGFGCMNASWCCFERPASRIEAN